MKMLDKLSSQDKAAMGKIINAICLSGGFMVVEVIAGYFAGSLALIADAAHVLSDVASFILSGYAIYYGSLPGCSKLSFGHGRMEVIVALASVLMIWIVTAQLLREAVSRLISYDYVLNPKIIFVTGIFGLISNATLLFVLGAHSHGMGGHEHLGEGGCDHSHMTWRDMVPIWLGGRKNHHDHHHHHENDQYLNAETLEANQEKGTLKTTHDHTHSDGACNHDHEHNHDHGHDHDHNHDHEVETNMNLKAAYLHALGDLLQNIGVIIAGALLMIFPKAIWIDPVVTILFSLIVVYSTWDLLKQITDILMQKVPDNLDLVAVQHKLETLEDVVAIHDVHAWSVSSTRPNFTCHVVIKEGVDREKVLGAVTTVMHEEFKIYHTTIQVENDLKPECQTIHHEACHAHVCDVSSC